MDITNWLGKYAGALFVTAWWLFVVGIMIYNLKFKKHARTPDARG